MADEKIRTTVMVDKRLFLKFKSLCALHELRMSEEIEKLIKKRIEELQ